MTANEIQASKDLEAIRGLLRNEDFTSYYQRRQREILEESRENVLHGKFSSPAELWEARIRLHALEEMGGVLDRDAQGARNVLPEGDGL